MIHVTISASAPLASHSCGHVPQLVEARGHTLTDARLLGMPSRLYHVECCRCSVATRPVWSARTAELLWAEQILIVPTTHLQPLRIQAERGLLNAA